MACIHIFRTTRYLRVFNAEYLSPYTRSEHGWRESCTLFVRPVDDSDWGVGLHSIRVQRLEHLKGRHDADYPIVFASRGLRVWGILYQDMLDRGRGTYTPK